MSVGPDSAGSTPGPAAYGRGGTQATITDAFVTLGLLDLSALGYGMVTVERDRAVAVIEPLAERLGRTLEDTAEGIVGIAVSGMFREVSKLCSRRGIDVAEYSLLAFGGGGPMMACFLARDLGMKRVIVPPSPGVLSALGGLTADVRNDFTETAYYDLIPANTAKMSATIERLSAKARRWMLEDQQYTGTAVFHASGEMRYRGQSFEIEVPIDPAVLAKGDLEAVAEAFHAEPPPPLWPCRPGLADPDHCHQPCGDRTFRQAQPAAQHAAAT